MKRSRQHFKGKKRLSSWHRGRRQGDLWEHADDQLPDVATVADPTTADPIPLHLHRGPGRTRQHGDAV